MLSKYAQQVLLDNEDILQLVRSYYAYDPVLEVVEEPEIVAEPEIAQEPEVVQEPEIIGDEIHEIIQLRAGRKLAIYPKSISDPNA